MEKQKYTFWIIFCAGILFVVWWLFFWKGILELKIMTDGNVLQQSYSVEFSSGKTVVCKRNPCQIRLRAKKKFTAEIHANGFLSQSFQTEKISAFSVLKQEINILSAPKLEKMSVAVFDQEQWDREEKFSVKKRNIFGPALFDASGQFMIFAEYKDSRLSVKIADITGQEDILTTISGKFNVLDMQNNFHLQSDGIVIPEEHVVYFFDFVTQKTKKITTKDPYEFSSLSVSPDGEFIAKRENKWEIFDGEELSSLGYSTQTAVFENGDLWELRGTEVFRNNQLVFQFTDDLKRFYEFWFDQGSLFIKGDDEVWKVEF